ncbi:FecR family protein [Parvibium lacunae]|nr:FecR domain-containing protein [Parvibium lacunae]
MFARFILPLFLGVLCPVGGQVSAQSKTTRSAAESKPVAWVVRVYGEVLAWDKNKVSRELKVGSPLYQEELVETGDEGAYAVLVFEDETKVTLQPESVLKLQVLNYLAKQPKNGQFVTELFRGGLRMLTGLIAKARPQNVRITTPTATIGIRGTGFDLSCTKRCADPDYVSDDDDPEEGAGLSAHVWLGSITLEPAATYPALLILQGQSANYNRPNMPPQIIPLPRVLQFSTPRPDGVPVNMSSVGPPCVPRYGQHGYASGGPGAPAAPGLSQMPPDFLGGGMPATESLSGMGFVDPDRGMAGLQQVERVAKSLPKYQQMQAPSRGEVARTSGHFPVNCQ